MPVNCASPIQAITGKVFVYRIFLVLFQSPRLLKVGIVTLSRVSFWGSWAGVLATLTAALLCLAVQFGYLGRMAETIPKWLAGNGSPVIDALASAEGPPSRPVSRIYSLFYADAGQALIVYDQNLIVVGPGSVLPDGSHVLRLSADRLVTTSGRIMHLR